MTQTEIERKWLVTLPDNPENWLIELPRQHITQTYLGSHDGFSVNQVREIIHFNREHTGLTHTYCEKSNLSENVREEYEVEIPIRVYQQLKLFSLSTHDTICKTRWDVLCEGSKFELDYFPDLSLWMMELEVDSVERLTGHVYFPDFISIIAEVTGNRDFNNFALARKDRS